MLLIYLSMLEDQDDAERFERIYDKYRSSMSKIAFAILRDEELAFNAVSSSFVSIAKNMKSLPTEDDEDYERSYIHKIVKHAAIDEARKKKQTTYSLNLDIYHSQLSDSSPEDKVIQDERLQALLNVIKSMPDSNRDVLIMRYVNEFTATEIAKILNMPLNTVKSKIQRGTITLRKAISEIYKSDEVREHV